MPELPSTASLTKFTIASERNDLGVIACPIFQVPHDLRHKRNTNVARPTFGIGATNHGQRDRCAATFVSIQIRAILTADLERLKRKPVSLGRAWC